MALKKQGHAPSDGTQSTSPEALAASPLQSSNAADSSVIQSKAERKTAEAVEAARLNELARLYPWRGFTQGELELMTNFPRQAVSAAFGDAEFPAHFGQARPEDIFAWMMRQPNGIRTKEVA